MLFISTDFHIDNFNHDLMVDLMDQQCKIISESGYDVLYVGGDIFESREAQRISALQTFQDMLDIALSYNIQLRVIPGNHDKTVYTEEVSFLRYFKHHPSLMLVESNATFIEKGFGGIHMIPYFNYGCDNWIKNFGEIKEKTKDFSKNILIGHFSVDGSINNDGSKVKGGIGKKELKDFDLVLLGHYHNQQQPNEKTYHIGSIKQKDFGEDQNKGLYFVDDQFNIELIQLEFPLYKKVYIDLNESTFTDILDNIDIYKDEATYNHIRFVLNGEESDVMAFDKSLLTEVGIGCQKKINREIVDLPDAKDLKDEVLKYNKETITERFDEFCERKGYNKEQGFVILNDVIG